ncbi:MAG: tRNA (adenosine(37)-N6)-threonylcarbamoyltransferase complex dimerization subunit type 1 TsaB [bacterium]|nr:tRNA (adenosine(37)-N6)-threonylcarbamoyltransferase complex dimerization subunit type 1 TsaB [bacterium]MBU1918891.1 tRNA (adenosine(37)-N6)-threonylcarbamoyltransferase complex dimerization subunit type 1 TsaB [bacterium]
MNEELKNNIGKKLTFCLDCSVKKLTLALIEDNTIIGSYNDIPQTTQSEALISKVDIILKQSHKSIQDISDVLFCHGPGSFTSLRIGLATLKGLFWNANISLKLCSSLLFRCLSVPDNKEKEIISSIRMGRDRVVAGKLKKQVQDKFDFNEDIYSLEEFENSLKKFCVTNEEDKTDPQAFLTILKTKCFIQSDMKSATLNYIMEPDIG